MASGPEPALPDYPEPPPPYEAGEPLGAGPAELGRSEEGAPAASERPSGGERASDHAGRRRRDRRTKSDCAGDVELRLRPGPGAGRDAKAKSAAGRVGDPRARAARPGRAARSRSALVGEPAPLSASEPDLSPGAAPGRDLPDGVVWSSVQARPLISLPRVPPSELEQKFRRTKVFKYGRRKLVLKGGLRRPVFEVVERQSSTPARPARSAPAGQPGAGRRGERAPPAKTPPPRPPPPSFTALRESPPSYDEVLRLDAAAMAGLGPGSRTSVPCLAGTGDLIDFDTPIFSPASVPSPAPDSSPAPIASTAPTPSTVRSPSPAPTPSTVPDPWPVLAPSPAPLSSPASSTSLRGDPSAPSRLSLGSRVSTVSLGSGEPSPGPGTAPAACAGLAPPQDPPGGDSPPVRAPPRGQFRSAGAAGRGRVAEGVRPARRSSRQTAPDGGRGSGEAADRAADRRRSLGRDAAQAPVDRAVSRAGGGEGSLGGVSGTPPDPAAGGLDRDSSPGGAAGGAGTAPPDGVQGPDRGLPGTEVSAGIGSPASSPVPCHGDSSAETSTPSDPPPAIQGQNDPPARLDSRSPEGPVAPSPDRRESSSADSGRGGGSPCASGSSGSGHEDRPTDAAWDSLPEPADCTCGPDTPQAIALYDFRSTEPGDLSFKEGDTVRLLRWVDADWLLGRLGGRQGLVPALYVSVTVPLPGGRTGPPPPPPLARQLSQDGVRAMALYDFAAQEQYDLGFQAGDLVLVLGKLNDDWGYGSRRGRSGQFPLVYLDVDIDQLPEL